MKRRTRKQEREADWALMQRAIGESTLRECLSADQLRNIVYSALRAAMPGLQHQTARYREYERDGIRGAARRLRSIARAGLTP